VHADHLIPPVASFRLGALYLLGATEGGGGEETCDGEEASTVVRQILTSFASE
jgi:hypothetical protein